MDYQTIRARLTPEARDLFLRMVEVHNASTGHRRFMYLRTLGGSSLDFFGEPRWSLDDPDENAIHDLRDYGLIRPHFGTRDPQFTISGESLAFYRWLLEQDGTPVTQVASDSLRVVYDSGFASRHPKASQHLGKAFDLLRSGETDSPSVSELGGHLRHAMFELVSDSLGEGSDPEQPIPRLKARIDDATLSEREKKLLRTLVDLTEATLSLDQRLTHIRDEVDKAEPLRGWDEIRRAAFTTVFVLHELDQALR